MDVVTKEILEINLLTISVQYIPVIILHVPKLLTEEYNNLRDGYFGLPVPCDLRLEKASFKLPSILIPITVNKFTARAKTI